MRASARLRWITLGLLCGCAAHFNPRQPGKLQSKDAVADEAFQKARGAFEAGRYAESRKQFKRFAANFADDPLAPFAQVFSGRAAYESGDYQDAIRDLEAPAAGPPDRGSTESARFYLGLARARLGGCTQARELLNPIEARIAGEDSLDLHALLAAC